MIAEGELDVDTHGRHIAVSIADIAVLLPSLDLLMNM